MAVMKEWFCGEHGAFDGTHPICPHLGCESAEVVREFRTAPSIRSEMTSRTDAGLQKTMDVYGMTNMKSARVGESAKANNQADGVLWGDKASQFLGKPLTQAHNPVSFKVKDGSTGEVKEWTDHGGMRTAANELGITRKVLPPVAEKVIASDDAALRKQLGK